MGESSDNQQSVNKKRLTHIEGQSFFIYEIFNIIVFCLTYTIRKAIHRRSRQVCKTSIDRSFYR